MGTAGINFGGALGMARRIASGTESCFAFSEVSLQQFPVRLEADAIREKRRETAPLRQRGRNSPSGRERDWVGPAVE